MGEGGEGWGKEEYLYNVIFSIHILYRYMILFLRVNNINCEFFVIYNWCNFYENKK